MGKVLIIEEDIQFINEIALGLRELGYEYIKVTNVNRLLEVALNADIELIIMDVKLSYNNLISDMNNGTFSNVPVVFVKSPDKEQENGANKVTLGHTIDNDRNFEIENLMARVQVTFGKRKSSQRNFQIGKNVNVDLKKQLVQIDGTEVELTRKEFDLLEVLVINPNVNMSREKIHELVWGDECSSDSRTVDVHIRKLRKKLHLEDYIITVYKMGYKLEM
ncbi:DNA-binding response regulator, OmpR family, contains REC and winged-helix (wHTH) domain [Hathewaya proteolytica DSM 3090]|uniref:DNA-binding response regulator, OmpR family, contains REC and winged-helix (WHTH) domain n=1 Tax=Hathewaya proteolytica DSM 3090 TaxID=1121331 RepID=A0A1M6QKI5_9CLOT|nr:response regulator transcription factor [Hathewaya proteolytica]SHK20678.1 DNA-binding response regulator, OmpR family, contains REC and winged-helix (wHTH) domain [Hathewaya proteolytica DSM 3090]